MARQRLAGISNVTIHEASLDAMPLADGSMDFGYSLGIEYFDDKFFVIRNK